MAAAWGLPIATLVRWSRSQFSNRVLTNFRLSQSHIFWQRLGCCGTKYCRMTSLNSYRRFWSTAIDTVASATLGMRFFEGSSLPPKDI